MSVLNNILLHIYCMYTVCTYVCESVFVC